MMEELLSSREDEGSLEDADATTEGTTVEVQAGEMRPLSQPSAKKGALHVPIAMGNSLLPMWRRSPLGKHVPPST